MPKALPKTPKKISILSGCLWAIKNCPPSTTQTNTAAVVRLKTQKGIFILAPEGELLEYQHCNKKLRAKKGNAVLKLKYWLLHAKSQEGK